MSVYSVVFARVVLFENCEVLYMKRHMFMVCEFGGFEYVLHAVSSYSQIHAARYTKFQWYLGQI